MAQICIRIEDEELINALHSFINECDLDDLARLAENAFGGDCSYIDGDFDFFPNENYMGAFGELKGKVKNE